MSNNNPTQEGPAQQDAFANVLNIPLKFKIVDLRAFFSDFIERERFQIFHYLHSPETLENNTLGTNKCLVQLKTLRDLNDFISRYNNKLWTDKTGLKFDAMCVIEKTTASANFNIEGDSVKEPENEPASDTKFLTNKQRRAMLEKKKSAATNSAVNLELVAPPGLPQGNVGTSRREIKRAIDRCALPTSVLKGLGIQQKALSDKLFGAVPLNYREMKSSTREYDPVDYVDHPLDYYKEMSKGKKSRKRRRAEIEDNYLQHYDSGNSSGEEWDRYQAMHGDDTEEGYLYEEKVEKPWDKGGSGLVTYTDAVHWDSLKGDDDERDVDDWDMKLSAKKDGPENRRTSVHRRPRKQFKFTPRTNQISTTHGQAIAGINVETTPGTHTTGTTNSNQDHQSAAPSTSEDFGAFEKHNKGTASQIMAKMGWNYGQGIGPKGREGIAEPIQLDANTATYGLGYKPVHVPKRTNQSTRPFIPTVYDSDYYRPNSVSNPACDTVAFRSVNGVKQRLISFAQGEVIDANGNVVNKERETAEYSAVTDSKIEALSAYEDVED